ncbi:MAG: M20 family metallo-hydrolase [Ginsengibacter sp.]
MQEQPSFNKAIAETMYPQALQLLKQLISTPSFSKTENVTADLIQEFFTQKNIPVKRYLNNIWTTNKYFDLSKPTVFLNSHHDTVKPNSGYSIDPFAPDEIDGKLYGLGSNDAGGCLVSLISAFIHFHKAEDLKYNLVLVTSAEEEISGRDGVEGLLKQKDFLKLTAVQNPYNNWCGIVGEPTLLNMAVAEKGLMVLDCEAKGRAGHAAREEGENALYKAITDIDWLRQYKFSKVSDLLGPVKINVTSIFTDNKAHNVVPASCNFIVDVRVNELYTFDEVLAVLKDHLKSDIKPRSTRLRSSSIDLDHPLVVSGLKLSRSYYGSPTTSDKALLSFPALKIGPGDSARSHSANEFIYLKEIEEGITLYIDLLNNVIS